MTAPDDGNAPEEMDAVPVEAQLPPMPAMPAEPGVTAAPVVPMQPAPPAAQYASAPPYAAAPPQAYAAPNPAPQTWMNIVAFVTGILGGAIIPIVFGHLGIRAANKGKAELKWMGIVGAILGYLELVFWITVWAIVVGGALSNANN